MKALYTLLALTGAALLPACTVHYHGVGPGHPDYHSGVVRTHRTDTVYVGSSSTTVITQPGTVGGPRGGYYGNGPGRQPTQPPVRGGYGQGGGVRTPPGTTPPPRTNGGVRNPGTRQPSAPTAGTGSGQYPPVRTPGTGTTAPSGPTRTPAGSGPPPGSGPVRTPGNIVTASPGTTSPGGAAASPGTQPTGAGAAPVLTASGQAEQDALIKPVRRDEAAGASVIINPSSPTDPSNSGQISNPPTGQASQDYPTGGIKPVRSEVEDPATGGTKQQSEDFQTGGIKPIRTEQPGHSGEVPAGQGMTVADAPGNTKGTEAMPAFMFAKMPCRGTCPAYTATIWPNGRVVYVGQQNVERVGTYELHLEPATVASIQQQAQSLGFAGLPASFASGNADIPATMLTMYSPSGKPKTVSVEDTAPAEVQAFFDSIHGTLTQLVASSQFPEERVKSRRGR